jgi:hypothetical protein
MLNRSDKVSLGLVLLATIIVINPFAAKTYAQSNRSIDIFPINSSPFGLSYENYVMNYWKLMLSIPIDKSPMEDKTGERCTFGQATPHQVFYLAGNAGGSSTLTCKIKTGLSVFIPVITEEASQAEAPKATIRDLHNIAKSDQDHVTSLFLKVNDKQFSDQDLRKFRTHTKDFQVTFPNNALFGAAPGKSAVVADGYYVITKPLSPGNYTIAIKSSLACLKPDCAQPTFASDIKYNLIVS